MLYVSWCKKVGDCAARDSEKCAACKTAEEPCDEEGLDVFCYCASHYPDSKEAHRGDVYPMAAIELCGE